MDLRVADTKVCSKCKIEKPIGAFDRRGDRGRVQSRCKECRSSQSSDLYADVVYDVLEMYGSECACCGEDNPAFLTISHVNNDGKQHREEVGRNMYRWVRDNAPDDIIIECYNCNCSRRTLDVCPHQEVGIPCTV